LNFPPSNDYASRAVNLYNAETSRIDALMFGVTDRRHADYALPPLSAGQTYYWKMVSTTMASKTKSGSIRSFGT